MKKNIVLFIFIGIFIGLGTTYFAYDKVFKKDEVKVELLQWNLYDENKILPEIFIKGVMLNRNIYGVLKNDSVKVSDLTEEEKAIVIFNYIRDTYEDYYAITFDMYEKASYELFKEQVEKLEMVYDYNSNFYQADFDKKVFKTGSVLVEYATYDSVRVDDTYDAYKYGDMIYFDVPLTFVRYEKDNNIFSNNKEFTNIYCEGYECNPRYIKYRLSFKLDTLDNKYKFVESKKLGSE